ncbi:hypothetical protein D3877_19640 [Azospirillum cavernae]|uniref:Uncharacterized protein n=1 Tax=Azospirillum cavernae TaxID=2320860 RepID=A0A418VYL2_9PROT|nr:hypothetical protein [Azospirillum cavernae]RJF82259.1 hypothetical protein D3877_19640 [Azospirillum cavernae]
MTDERAPPLAAWAALAGALGRAATVADAAAIRAQAVALPLPPNPKGHELPLDVLAAYSPADRRAHLLAQYGPALEALAAAALCRHLRAVIADPAVGAPDAVTTAEALAALLARHGDARTPLRARVDEVVSALVDSARQSTDHLRVLLDTPDGPDLRSIAFDLLRIEAVRWVLEILGHQSGLASLSEHARRLSRLTLMRSAETIRAFISKPDLLTLYDNVAVVSQTDHLLTVALRLLDALRDGEEERTAFVIAEDEAALRAFGKTLNALANLLARIAGKAAGRTDVTPSLAVSALEQLTLLHQFCARLGSSKPPEFAMLEQVLRHHAHAIAARFHSVLAENPAPPPPGPAPSPPNDGDQQPLAVQARALANLLACVGAAQKNT